MTIVDLPGASPVEAPETPEPAPSEPTRKRGGFGRFVLRGFFLLAVPVATIAAAGYFYATGGRYVTAENAYVKASIVNISPDIDGRVVRVLVADNQQVEEGQLLFQLDTEPYEISLAAADAELTIVRQRITSMRAQYRQGQREIAAAGERTRYLVVEYERQEQLQSKGTGSRAKFDAALHDLEMSRQQIEVLREQNRMVLAELGGKLDAPIERHPLYLQAKARRDRAALDLAHTAAYAPVAGVLSAVGLETGEYVEAGDLVFALIATGDPWIEVNLKEVHLTHIEVGQKATAVVDAYPDEVFDATVDSISPATGAVFSLLPPQNATGNWVKVVQRVPVRLKLDARHDTARLRAGMTVTVSIDTERERDIKAMIKNALADALDAL